MTGHLVPNFLPDDEADISAELTKEGLRLTRIAVARPKTKIRPDRITGYRAIVSRRFRHFCCGPCETEKRSDIFGHSDCVFLREYSNVLCAAIFGLCNRSQSR